MESFLKACGLYRKQEDEQDNTYDSKNILDTDDTGDVHDKIEDNISTNSNFKHYCNSTFSESFETFVLKNYEFQKRSNAVNYNDDSEAIFEKIDKSEDELSIKETDSYNQEVSTWCQVPPTVPKLVIRTKASSLYSGTNNKLRDMSFSIKNNSELQQKKEKGRPGRPKKHDRSDKNKNIAKVKQSQNVNPTHKNAAPKFVNTFTAVTVNSQNDRDTKINKTEVGTQRTEHMRMEREKRLSFDEKITEVERENKSSLPIRSSKCKTKHAQSPLGRAQSNKRIMNTEDRFIHLSKREKYLSQGPQGQNCSDNANQVLPSQHTGEYGGEPKKSNKDKLPSKVSVGHSQHSYNLKLGSSVPYSNAQKQHFYCKIPTMGPIKSSRKTVQRKKTSKAPKAVSRSCKKLQDKDYWTHCLSKHYRLKEWQGSNLTSIKLLKKKYKSIRLLFHKEPVIHLKRISGIEEHKKKTCDFEILDREDVKIRTEKLDEKVEAEIKQNDADSLVDPRVISLSKALQSGYNGKVGLEKTFRKLGPKSMKSKIKSELCGKLKSNPVKKKGPTAKPDWSKLKERLKEVNGKKILKTKDGIIVEKNLNRNPLFYRNPVNAQSGFGETKVPVNYKRPAIPQDGLPQRSDHIKAVSDIQKNDNDSKREDEKHSNIANPPDFEWNSENQSESFVNQSNYCLDGLEDNFEDLDVDSESVANFGFKIGGYSIEICRDSPIDEVLDINDSNVVEKSVDTSHQVKDNDETMAIPKVESTGNSDSRNPNCYEREDVLIKIFTQNSQESQSEVNESVITSVEETDAGKNSSVLTVTSDIIPNLHIREDQEQDNVDFPDLSPPTLKRECESENGANVLKLGRDNMLDEVNVANSEFEKVLDNAIGFESEIGDNIVDIVYEGKPEMAEKAEEKDEYVIYQNPSNDSFSNSVDKNLGTMMDCFDLSSNTSSTGLVIQNVRSLNPMHRMENFYETSPIHFSDNEFETLQDTGQIASAKNIHNNDNNEKHDVAPSDLIVKDLSDNDVTPLKLTNSDATQGLDEDYECEATGRTSDDAASMVDGQSLEEVDENIYNQNTDLKSKCKDSETEVQSYEEDSDTVYSQEKALLKTVKGCEKMLDDEANKIKKAFNLGGKKTDLNEICPENVEVPDEDLKDNNVHIEKSENESTETNDTSVNERDSVAVEMEVDNHDKGTNESDTDTDNIVKQDLEIDTEEESGLVKELTVDEIDLDMDRDAVDKDNELSKEISSAEIRSVRNGKEKLQKMLKKHLAWKQSSSDDELPKILPPKRRQRVHHHQPAQEGKMSSDLTTEHLMQALPNHNWLFDKYKISDSPDEKQKMDTESSTKDGGSPTNALNKFKRLQEASLTPGIGRTENQTDKQSSALKPGLGYEKRPCYDPRPYGYDLTMRTQIKKPFILPKVATADKNISTPRTTLHYPNFGKKSPQVGPDTSSRSSWYENSSNMHTVACMNEQNSNIINKEIDSCLEASFRHCTGIDADNLPAKTSLNVDVLREKDSCDSKHVEINEGFPLKEVEKSAQDSVISHDCAGGKISVDQSRQTLHASMADTDSCDDGDGVNLSHSESSELSGIDQSKTDEQDVGELDKPTSENYNPENADATTENDSKEAELERVETESSGDMDEKTNRKESTCEIQVATVMEKSAPLDLCTIKSESCSVNFRSRSKLPVQLVHPQVHVAMCNDMSIEQLSREEAVPQIVIQTKEMLSSAQSQSEDGEINRGGNIHLSPKLMADVTAETEVLNTEDTHPDRRETITTDLEVTSEVAVEANASSNDAFNSIASENNSKDKNENNDLEIGRRRSLIRKSNTAEVPPVPALINASLGRGLGTTVIPVQPIIQSEHNISLQNSPVQTVGPFQSGITLNPVNVQTLFIPRQTGGQVSPLRLQNQSNQSVYQSGSFQTVCRNISPKTSQTSNLSLNQRPGSDGNSFNRQTAQNVNYRPQGQFQGQPLQGQIVQVSYQGIKLSNAPPPLLYQQPQIIQVQPQSFNQNFIQGLNSSPFVGNQLSPNVYNQTGQVFSLNESKSVASFVTVQSLTQLHQRQNTPQNVISSSEINAAVRMSSAVSPVGQITLGTPTVFPQIHKNSGNVYLGNPPSLGQIAMDNNNTTTLNTYSSGNLGNATYTQLSNEAVDNQKSGLPEKEQSEESNVIKTETEIDDYLDEEDDEFRKKMQELDEDIKRKEREQEEMKKKKLELLQQMKLAKSSFAKSTCPQNVPKAEMSEKDADKADNSDSLEKVTKRSEAVVKEIAQDSKPVTDETLLKTTEAESEKLTNQVNERAAILSSDTEEIKNTFQEKEIALDLSTPAKETIQSSKGPSAEESVCSLYKKSYSGSSSTEQERDPVLSSVINKTKSSNTSESMDLTMKSNLVIDMYETSDCNDKVPSMSPIESLENPVDFDLPDQKDTSMEFIADIGEVNPFTGEYDHDIDEKEKSVQQTEENESLDLTTTSRTKQKLDEKDIATSQIMDKQPLTATESDDLKNDNVASSKEAQTQESTESVYSASKLHITPFPESYLSEPHSLDNSLNSLDLSLKKAPKSDVDKTSFNSTEVLSNTSLSITKTLSTTSDSPLTNMSTDTSMLTTPFSTLQSLSQSVITTSVACTAVSALVSRPCDKSKDVNNADKYSNVLPRTTDAEVHSQGLPSCSMITLSSASVTLVSSSLSSVTSPVIRASNNLSAENTEFFDSSKRSPNEPTNVSQGSQVDANPGKSALNLSNASRQWRFHDYKKDKPILPAHPNKEDRLIPYPSLHSPPTVHSQTGMRNSNPNCNKNLEIEKKLHALQMNVERRQYGSGQLDEVLIFDRLNDPSRKSHSDHPRKHKSRLIELLPAHYKHSPKKIPKGARPAPAHGAARSIKHELKLQNKSHCKVPSHIQQSCPFIPRKQPCKLSPREIDTTSPRIWEKHMPSYAHSQKSFGIAGQLIIRNGNQSRKRNTSGEFVNNTSTKFSSEPNTPTASEMILPRSTSTSALPDTLSFNRSQLTSPENLTGCQRIGTPPISKTSSREPSCSPIRAHCKLQSLVSDCTVSVTHVLRPPGLEDERTSENSSSVTDNIEVIDLTSEPAKKKTRKRRRRVLEQTEYTIQRELTAAMAKRQREAEQLMLTPPPSYDQIVLRQQQARDLELGEIDPSERQYRNVSKPTFLYNKAYTQQERNTNQSPNVTVQNQSSVISRTLPYDRSGSFVDPEHGGLVERRKRNRRSPMKTTNQHVGPSMGNNLSQPPMLVQVNSGQNMFRIAPPSQGRMGQSRSRFQGQQGDQAQEFQVFPNQLQEVNMQTSPDLMHRLPSLPDMMHRPRGQMMSQGSITQGIPIQRPQFGQKDYNGPPAQRMSQANMPGFQSHAGPMPSSYPTSTVMPGYQQRPEMIHTGSPNSTNMYQQQNPGLHVTPSSAGGPGGFQHGPRLIPATSGSGFQQRSPMIPGMMVATCQNTENLHQLLQQPRMQPVVSPTSPSGNIPGLQQKPIGDVSRMQSLTEEQKIRLVKMQKVRAQHIRSQQIQARNQQLSRDQGSRMANPAMVQQQQQHQQQQGLQQHQTRDTRISSQTMSQHQMQGTRMASPGNVQLQQQQLQGTRMSGPGNVQLQQHQMQGTRMLGPGNVQFQQHQMQGTRMPGPGIAQFQQHQVQGTRMSGPAILNQQHQTHTQETIPPYMQSEKKPEVPDKSEKKPEVPDTSDKKPVPEKDGSSSSDIQWGSTLSAETQQTTMISPQYRGYKTTQEHSHHSTHPLPHISAVVQAPSAQQAHNTGYQQDGRNVPYMDPNTSQVQLTPAHQIPQTQTYHQSSGLLMNQQGMPSNTTTHQYSPGQENIHTNIHGQGPQMQTTYQGNSGIHQAAPVSHLTGNQHGIYIPVQTRISTTPILNPPISGNTNQIQQSHVNSSTMATQGQQRSTVEVQGTQQQSVEEMEKNMPHLQQIHGACIMCGKFSLYLCSSCKKIWYCSPECQLSHWQTHANECLGEPS